MENRSHALAAGIFVLLFGFAAGLALWWLGQSDESVDHYVLETRKNVTGLNLQAIVRYRGIRAGKVNAIDTDPNDPRIIQVRISLDSRFKLTKGTTAQLGYQGVTGLAYVQLEDDGSSAELLKVGAGDTAPRIPLKATLFDTLGEKAGDIVTQVGTVAARLASILDEKNARNISRTLENVAVASDGMKELPVLMASLRQALSAGNLQRLQQILAHVEKTAGEAAPLTAELRELVRSMNALSQKLDRVAAQGDSAGQEVAATTLPRANALMRELSTNARQINQLLENLESNPQMLLFGRDAVKPGPGEAGFAAPGN
jgi:phospholipid/cholesterol/gamma-HCH transport system substrate-binding protein